MNWIISAIIQGVLNWAIKFFGGLIEGWTIAAGNKKRNQEIKDDVDKSQTPEEIQAALDAAAQRLGLK